MKTLFSSVIFLVGLTLAATAQTSTVSLDEIDSKLQTGELTTSSVLTDKKYLSLHPETPFRELIKKHSSASILTITIEDELPPTPLKGEKKPIFSPNKFPQSREFF